MKVTFKNWKLVSFWGFSFIWWKTPWEHDILQFFSFVTEHIWISKLLCWMTLNSSLTMSLGAGGPNANSREKVSMATLEAGPHLKQPLTDTITLNKIQWRYFPMIIITWERKETLQKGNNPRHPAREGREGARIRNDLQEQSWSAMISKQSNKAKTALVTNTKEALQNPKGHPHRSHIAMEDNCRSKDQLLLLLVFV